MGQGQIYQPQKNQGSALGTMLQLYNTYNNFSNNDSDDSPDSEDSKTPKLGSFDQNTGNSLAAMQRRLDNQEQGQIASGKMKNSGILGSIGSIISAVA